jgi:hypothetical protein
MWSYRLSYEISSSSLFALNRLKQRLKVTSAETGKIIPLDDLDEDSWPIHKVLKSLSAICDVAIVINGWSPWWKAARDILPHRSR